MLSEYGVNATDSIVVGVPLILTDKSGGTNETFHEKAFADLFNKTLKTGQTDILLPVSEEAKKWLGNLNKSYQNMVINLEIIDLKHGKLLYEQIDDLYDKINQKFSITLDKIKKLKVNLMKAILEKDYDDLKLISNHAKNLSLKYSI